MADIADQPDAIRLGSMLFTLVEPHKGHEVEYNRWYERDHFYAGCMVGPWLFAGKRWVATSDLKDGRPDIDPPLFGDPRRGTYLAVYWVQKGKHGEHFGWATEQVRFLHDTGRMFPHRDHVHTLLYRHAWTIGRDPDGVPTELALDHPYQGLYATIVERTDPDDGDTLDRFTGAAVPDLLVATPAGLAVGFRPIPLPDDAPVDQGALPALQSLMLTLWFLDKPPSHRLTPTLSEIGDSVAASGLGRLVWASGFRPTIPGTDTYTDQLW